MMLLVCMTYRVGNRLCERYFMNSSEGRVDALNVWSNLNRNDRISLQFATVGENKTIILGDPLLDVPAVMHYDGDEYPNLANTTQVVIAKVATHTKLEFTWKDIWQNKQESRLLNV